MRAATLRASFSFSSFSFPSFPSPVVGVSPTGTGFSIISVRYRGKYPNLPYRCPWSVESAKVKRPRRRTCGCSSRCASTARSSACATPLPCAPGSTVSGPKNAKLPHTVTNTLPRSADVFSSSSNAPKCAEAYVCRV